MPYPVPLRCSSCGSTLVPNQTPGMLSCPYCGGIYSLDDTHLGKHQESGNSKTVTEGVKPPPPVPDVAALIEEAKHSESYGQFQGAVWMLASIRSDAAIAY